MSKIITQKAEENKQISERIKSFMKRFEVSSALKSSNAVKIKGFAVIEIFQYLFMLVFAHRSIYMDMKRDTVPFAKDTVYRFLNSARINWLKFTTRLSAKIIEEAIEPLTSEQRKNVLIIDDSVFERNRSKKVELLTKVFDHAKRKYFYGFRMLTLGWSDGNTFMPVNSVLLSSENDNTVMNIPEEIDKRSNAYKRRNLSRSKATDAMITLIKEAEAACIKASYVLFDSWFASPDSICKIRNLGYDVIAMIKKTPKVFYEYNGKMRSVCDIYKSNKKRRGRSRYLLSVNVNVVKNDNAVPAKIVFVRNRNKRSDYLCILSTDTSLTEDEIIRIYGKRWSIEVFFKVCKSYLCLTKECKSISFDAMTAHTAVVFTRYMMLAVSKRESEDPRSMGELFMYCTDELADISFAQAFSLFMDLFISHAEKFLTISEQDISVFVDKFFEAIPDTLKIKLKAA
ncbi:MAG: transposase [Ruminococcus sp.]|nr:transposase [Ruminococcus sp.]